MGQYDEMRRVAMLTPGEAAYNGDPDLNRRDIRRELSNATDPRVRAVLQRELERVNGAELPPAVATSMRDGFPELRGAAAPGAATPPAGTGLGAFLARKGSGGEAPSAGAAPAREAPSLSSFLDSIPEAPPAPPPPAGIVRRAADYGLSALQGAVQVPQAAVGLVDLATGGQVGKTLENEGGSFGFRPDEANAYLESLKSNEQQAANKKVADASQGQPGDDQGLLSKVGRVGAAALQNPSVVAHTIVQSLPSMVAGGVLGRGALWLGLSSAEKAAILALPKAEQAAAIVTASRVPAAVAGGAGEGVTTMGQQAEQIRTDPANPDRLLTGKQSLLAAGSGLATGGIGMGSGRLAQKLGIENVENLLVGAHADQVAKDGLVRRIIGGAVTEGLLEELPQSVQEQVAQNIALNQPWDKDVDQAAVLGVLSGASMGSGAQVFHRPGDAIRAEAQPSTGTLSDAANVGVAINAAVADQNPTPAPEPAPPPVAPELATALLDHANKRAAELTEKAKGTKDEKGEDGKVKPGTPPAFLTPDEKAEQAFLKEHGGNAEALARAYAAGAAPSGVPNPISTSAGGMPIDTEAAIARIEAAGARDVADQRSFAPGPKPEPAPRTAAPVAAPAVTDPLAISEADLPKHEAGDILAKYGGPFKSRVAALNAQKAQPDPAGVVLARVQGGHVLRPVVTPTIDAAAHEAAPSPMNERPEPTQGQKEAGNYKLGHDTINGLNISFENPAGSVRKGVDRDGKAWENTLQHHYGYFKGTVGNDKDHVDVFVKPETPRDYAGPVFVIDQVHPDTGKFDEHKVMLGFKDIEEAQAAYDSNYADDWMGLHSITPMPFDQFKAWVHDGPKTAPLMPIKVKANEQDDQAGAKPEAEPVAKAADAPSPAPAVADPAGPAAAGPAAEPQAAGLTFKTARGSTYAVAGKTTTRDKAARADAGHEGDSGPKPKSDRTVYIDGDASRLSAAGMSNLGERGARVAIKDGKATLLTWNERAQKWGAAPSARDIAVHDDPAVGRSPLELWKPADDVSDHEAYRQMHAGNPITEIFGGEVAPAKKEGAVDRRKRLAAEAMAAALVAPGLAPLVARAKAKREAKAPPVSPTPTPTAAVEPATAAPAPAKPKRAPAAQRAYEAANAKRAEYFTPGNIVKGYGGFDEVLAYTPATEDKNWSVRVHHVEKVDGKWVRIGKPQDARNHSTQPEERNLKNGPIARVDAAPAADVPHTEPRADGKDFPNAEARGPLLASRPNSGESRALRALSETDELFALPKSTAKTVEGIAADNDPGIKVRAYPAAGLSRYLLTMPDGGIASIFVREPSEYGPHSYGSTFNDDNELTAAQTVRPGDNPEAIAPDVEDVWVDASKLKATGDGAKLYNIAQTFAHNTSRIFIGDPAGLSNDAMVRRPEQMLSSALKFGTTEHLAPHPRQIVGDAKIGVPALKWVYGDHDGNIERLIDLNLAAQQNAGNTEITFDPKNGQFHDSAGQVIDREGISLLAEAGLLGGRNVTGGRTTARSAVLRALLRDARSSAPGADGKRGGVLAQLAGRVQRGEPGTRELFYSRTDQPQQGGLNPDELRKAVAKIAADWKNSPKGGVTVVASADDLPAPMLHAARSADPEGVARAWFDPDTEAAYLIADRMPTLGDAQFALFHEVYGHYGMRSLLGDGYAKEMMRLRLANPNVAAGASMWFARYGQQEVADRVARGMDELAAQREVRLLSTEEALADLAGENRGLKGWQHVVAAIQKALRAIGLDKVADWMEARTDAEVLSFLNAARKQVRDRAPAARAPSTAAQPALASRPLGAALSDAMNSARDVKLPAGYVLGDLIDTHGKLNWWHKTVGTMHNLAERSPEFKRVYDSVQGFINDVSSFATEAADLAPKILPKLETWKDIAKSPMSAADTKAIGAPIFEGTLTWARDEKGRPVKVGELVTKAESMTSDAKSKELLRGGHISEGVLKMWQGLPIDQFENLIAAKYERDVLKAGVVWTGAELKSIFKLSDDQVALYREFRKATDRSLTNLAISDMIRFGGDDVDAVRAQALAAGDVDKAAVLLRDHLYNRADSDPARKDVLNDTAEKMIEKADRANDLMKRGYAPLSRFGSYTLDVVHNGERVYFGLFESKAERSRMARKMANEFKGAQVTQGTVSEEAHKLFAGVSPETLELFGDMLGLESQGDSASSKAFQTYIKLARSNRSAMKRLIERKGIAGFSEDAGRVLAGFVYSNARQTSSNLHMGEMSEAAADIPQGQGELKDAAVRLTDYVKNPREEAQAIRGVMFAQYLGGSIASAMVNMTQPFAVTFPYLSQYGGVAKAAKQMAAAVKDATKRVTGDKALDAALKHAEDEGIVSPQEVHQLMAQAQGRSALKSGDGTALGDAAAKASNVTSKVLLAWGKVFGVAEQYNRRVTFIAAYRTAMAHGIAEPAAFAAKAVADTQFTYNKGNKPQWARGAIGGTLFTFKQYSVNYVELLHRMWSHGGPEGKKAALLALGVMFLMGGADGLPFADDVNDVIDGALQRMGYNFSSKAAKQQFFADIFGQDGGRIVEKGLSGLPGVPIDVSGRLGLGNLIPGTGLLTKKTDHTSDVTELLGPAADLAKRAATAAGQLVTGQVGEGLTTIAPTAARNMVKAYDMANTGMYRDDKGRKVIDVDGYDALAKAIGFQPNDVARVQEATRQVQTMIGQAKLRETEIADQWAKALFEKDADGVREARDMLARWNENNPTSPIRIGPPQLAKRLRAMNQDKATRIEKTAPREIRATVRRELTESTQ